VGEIETYRKDNDDWVLVSSTETTRKPVAQEVAEEMNMPKYLAEEIYGVIINLATGNINSRTALARILTIHAIEKGGK
jgi:hypothetical protein